MVGTLRAPLRRLFAFPICIGIQLGGFDLRRAWSVLASHVAIGLASDHTYAAGARNAYALGRVRQRISVRNERGRVCLQASIRAAGRMP
jgi:hypothetical protein